MLDQHRVEKTLDLVSEEKMNDFQFVKNSC